MKWDEFAFLNQQLAGMLKTGIPLEGALRQLVARNLALAPQRRFRRAVAGSPVPRLAALATARVQGGRLFPVRRFDETNIAKRRPAPRCPRLHATVGTRHSGGRGIGTLANPARGGARKVCPARRRRENISTTVRLAGGANRRGFGRRFRARRGNLLRASGPSRGNAALRGVAGRRAG